MYFPLLILTWMLAGCASVITPYMVQTKDVDVGLTELQRLVANNLPAGLRTVSPNGREFHSRYFTVQKADAKTDQPREFVAATDALERFTAKYMVLGDRRPYNIEISVTRERLILRHGRYDYEVINHDLRLAKELTQKFREALSKRREDRNIIDDFRVF